MGIQKPYLDSFTAKELMAFIDCYVENHVLPQMPDHSPTECDLLARFLGFGYSREWSQGEIEILTGHYYGSGAEKTAPLIAWRRPKSWGFVLQSSQSGKAAPHGCFGKSNL